MEITAAAASTLINTLAPKVGARIPVTRDDVAAELTAAGYMGPHGGLTSRGLIARERLMDEALEKAFGA